jgi:hypothetical protein
MEDGSRRSPDLRCGRSGGAGRHLLEEAAGQARRRLVVAPRARLMVDMRRWCGVGDGRQQSIGCIEIIR